MEVRELEERELKAIDDEKWREKLMLDLYVDTGDLCPAIMWDSYLPEGPILPPDKVFPYVALLFKESPVCVWIPPLKDSALFEKFLGFTPENFLLICKRRGIQPIINTYLQLTNLDYLDEIIGISKPFFHHFKTIQMMETIEKRRIFQKIPPNKLNYDTIEKLINGFDKELDQLNIGFETSELGTHSKELTDQSMLAEGYRSVPLTRRLPAEWIEYISKSANKDSFKSFYASLSIGGYASWVHKLVDHAFSAKSQENQHIKLNMLRLGFFMLNHASLTSLLAGRSFSTVSEDDSRYFDKYNLQCISERAHVETFPKDWALTLLDIAGYKEKLEFKGRMPYSIRSDLDIDVWLKLSEEMSPVVKKGLEKRRYFYEKSIVDKGLAEAESEIPMERIKLEEIIRSMDAWASRGESCFKFMASSALIYLAVGDAGISFTSGLAGEMISNALKSSSFHIFLCKRFRDNIIDKATGKLIARLGSLHKRILQKPFANLILRTSQRGMPSDVRTWMLDLWTIKRAGKVVGR